MEKIFDFNEFFVNIGSKLAFNASKINSTGKEYHEYLNNQYKKKVFSYLQ